MGMVTSLDFDPVVAFVFDYLKLAPGPANTGTKIEQARKESEVLGKISAISDGIAYFYTAERVQMLGPLFLREDQRKWVDKVESYRVRSYLQNLKGRWDRKDFEGVSDEEFALVVKGELNEAFIGGEWYDKVYEPARREAVKTGVIEPDVNDAAWIKEEYSTVQALVSPYEQLLEKVMLKERHAEQLAELDALDI
jgi:hypothetical protein